MYMIKPSEVTIIIPHLGETKESEYSFDECYASLRESVPDIKIIVVKNGSACPHPRNLRYVGQGQCISVDAAVSVTDTPWIFVTNDDMIYPPGWFNKFVIGITEDMYCISPKLVEPRPGAPTFEVFFAGGAGGDFNKQKWLEFVEKYYLEYPHYGLRTGFNLPFLIKRDLWDLIGGYDINYDPWGSNGDSDLEYKIRLAGIQPYQNKDAIVYHFSQTSGTFEPRNDSYRFNNYAYFKEKWGFDRTDTGIWEANFPMPEEGRIFKPWWEGFYK